MISNTNSLSRLALILKMVITSVFLLVWAAGCTSAPSEAPEKFVFNFINKHIPMIDVSVADFYVKEEQKGIMERVQKFITSSKEKGLLESRSAATYDFSKIKITVLDQKEEYVNDEGVNFLKMAANGSYTKTVNGKVESLIEDEIFILESIAGSWKVTEKTNPWK
jgi:hypothetical protein